ncbi:MAG: prolyl-tRNA synthetase associated domain-containing protein [Candidatus Marsarchaeota archaeon]|jgi:Ala-tRNA(Pro) deacylase|nr:prolyl-tRNA synthetase associated domain-containing protein [Candidatus Marsarchaeota archaeon]
MDKYLKEYLDRFDVHYKLHEHKAVFTVGESGFLRSIIPGMHTKNLFLKDDHGQFYLVCMDGDRRLDMKALGKRLGAGKLHFGSGSELKSRLNLAPGSVSIFGMIYAKGTTLIVDRRVWNAETVSFHPNINTETLELQHMDLEKFYNSLDCPKEITDLE